MRGEVQGECEIVEKMYFNGLLDFVYVELMKGLAKGICAEALRELPPLVFADSGCDIFILQ